MKLTKHVKMLFAVLFAFAMIAAACGDSDDADDGTGTDDTTDDGNSGDDEAPADDAADDEAPADDTGDDDPPSDDGDDGDDSAAPPGEVTTDIGVDDTTIKVGLNADLSGAFAALTTTIVDGQEAFWEIVNDNGGIAGRQVETVVLDNAYDVPTHLENYEKFSGDGDDGVVMITNSTGSPHTAAIAGDLIEDDLMAIPLSWYSGWTDEEIGKNVFEVQASYCVEAMNGVTYMSEQHGQTLAIVSFPGDYGEDGAIGAQRTAEALGLEVVYDATGEVTPDSDVTPIVAGIVENSPDFVWLTVNPTKAAEIIGGAAAGGYEGQWSGNSPTYNPALLGTEIGDILDSSYTHSTYTELWDVGDGEGARAVVDGMREKRPDAAIQDTYIISWIEGYIAQQTLEKAAENGDMTRAGVLAAANEIEVDLKGLAPNQTWGGDPNEDIVRETYLFDVVKENFTPDAKVTEDGGTGFELLEGPYESPTATDFDYEPCFKA